VQGLDHHLVAANHRKALTTGEHMVIGVAAACDPYGACAGHEPSLLRGHPALHIVHQYLFHEGLLFVLNLCTNHRRKMHSRRMRIKASIDTNNS
jgi:hypothetical protein